jgi:hypothetical protein
MASDDVEGTYVGIGDDGVSSIDADQSGMRIIRYAVSVRDPNFALVCLSTLSMSTEPLHAKPLHHAQCEALLKPF